MMMIERITIQGKPYLTGIMIVNDTARRVVFTSFEDYIVFECEDKFKQWKDSQEPTKIQQRTDGLYWFQR